MRWKPPPPSGTLSSSSSSAPPTRSYRAESRSVDPAAVGGLHQHDPAPVVHANNHRRDSVCPALVPSPGYDSALPADLDEGPPCPSPLLVHFWRSVQNSRRSWLTRPLLMSRVSPTSELSAPPTIRSRARRFLASSPAR